MMTDRAELLLESIDKKLAAILAIVVDDYLRRTPNVGMARQRPIDKTLHDVGFTDAEVANLLGKSRQAVSQLLQREKTGKRT
jgi:hypothetical protein